MKIVHLISHPIQYHVPLYRLLAKQKDFQFEVFYERGPQKYYDEGFQLEIEWDVDLASGYRWVTVTTKRLRAALKAAKPDIVWLHGYSTLRQLYAWWLAKRMGCKVWLRGESSSLDPVRPLKAWVLRWLFRQADACLAIGLKNKEYYQNHSVPNGKIIMVPYAVDTDFWKPAKMKRDPNLIIYVGKLIPEKGLHRLNGYIPEGKRMVFVGDGPLRKECERMGQVTGFVGQRIVRRWMQRASCLILPSIKETYGMVVLEARACGCTVYATFEVNALYDDPCTQTYAADLNGIRYAADLR